MVEIADPVVDVELADILLSLLRLAAWLFVIGCCSAIVAFVYAILWPLNKLVSGVTGGLVGSVPGSHAVEQAVTSALGSSIAGFDHAVGGFWHGLKTVVDRTAAELFGIGQTLGYLAWYMTSKFSLTKLAHQLTHLHGVSAALRSAIHTAERDAARAEHIAKSTAAGVYPRIRTIEHDLSNVVAPEIASIRDIAKGAEADVTSLWDYVRSAPWTVATGAFAGAVAIALDTLGLGWIKCPAMGNLFNKRGCGVGNLLDDVLGLLADVVLISSLCDVLPWLTTGVDEIGLGLVAGIHASGLQACAGSFPPPPAMPAVELSLPPVYGIG